VAVNNTIQIFNISYCLPNNFVFNVFLCITAAGRTSKKDLLTLLNKKIYSDEELMEELAEGGKKAEQAFTYIYDNYAVRIRAYCFTVMGDSEKAGDIFQDTFIRFYKACTLERKNGTPIGWLLRTARNLCLNAKRDTKKNISIDDYEIGYDMELPMENLENQKIVGLAMDSLPDQMREAVALRYFEDMPYDGIGEILGITSARARYLVFTAKTKMKKTLKPYTSDFER
jgi:RNA polymerase sigma-70 factor (ECF subfamily)